MSHLDILGVTKSLYPFSQILTSFYFAQGSLEFIFSLHIPLTPTQSITQECWSTKDQNSFSMDPLNIPPVNHSQKSTWISMLGDSFISFSPHFSFHIFAPSYYLLWSHISVLMHNRMPSSIFSYPVRSYPRLSLSIT